jgi:hypothetical protein
LLTVDLQTIDPSWKGTVHFVYHEQNREGGIRFGLEDGRYRYAGPFGFDEGGMAERDRGSGWVEMLALDVPELTADNRPAWVDAVAEAGKEAGRRGVSYANHFGGRPYWTQSDQTPSGADGNPLRFIGQIRADDFSDEVPDKDLYLFFCPQTRSVVQIDQCT